MENRKNNAKKVYSMGYYSTSKINNKYYKVKPEPTQEDKDELAYIKNRRIWIEKLVSDILMRDPVSENEVYRLERNSYGKLLSLSPYALYENTSTAIDEWFRHWYNALSRKMHKHVDDRYRLEIEINDIIPITDDLVFRFFNFIEPILEHRDLLTKYCNIVRIPMLSNKEIKKVRNLIYKWREASSDCHYKMTKQEKRKLKKLYKKTNPNRSSVYVKPSKEERYMREAIKFFEFENERRLRKDREVQKRIHMIRMKKNPMLYKDDFGTVVDFLLFDWYHKCIAEYNEKNK